MARNQLVLQRGFTLIEMLVAITLSVILLAAASGLFFTTLRTDSKKTYVTDIKDHGDYAISQIEFLLRNAITLEPVGGSGARCASGMNQILLRSIDNGLTNLSIEEGRIASESSASDGSYVATHYLTGEHIAASNLSFNCQQSSPNIGTFIQINFTLTYSTASGQFFGDGGSENFTTTINVRSY